MPTDDIGFRSQQFAEQVEQRRDGYRQQRMASWQMLPQYVQGAIQNNLAARKMQMDTQRQQQDMLESSSRLALDELRRKQAIEELQWAEMLHTDEARQLSLRQQAAQTALLEKQAEKAARDLDPRPELSRPMDKRQLNAMGYDAVLENGTYRVIDADPEKIDAARRYYIEEERRVADEEHQRRMQLEEARSKAIYDRLLTSQAGALQRAQIGAESRVDATATTRRDYAYRDKLASLEEQMKSTTDKAKREEIAADMEKVEIERMNALQEKDIGTKVSAERLAALEQEMILLGRQSKAETDPQKKAAIEALIKEKMEEFSELQDAHARGAVKYQTAGEAMLDLIQALDSYLK